MDSEAEATIARVYYEFQNRLEPSIEKNENVDIIKWEEAKVITTKTTKEEDKPNLISRKNIQVD